MQHARVLVIDDDEIVRELMCETLRRSGCEVFDCGSPIGVSRLISQHQIQVVVVDVMMPDISGDKLARLLRSNPRLGNLGIVLVSGTNTESLQRIADEVDADAVVSKSALRMELAMAVFGAQRSRTMARVRSS